MDPPLHFIIFGPYNLAKRILNENYICGKKRNEFVSSCYLLSFLSHHNFSLKCFHDDFGLFDWMFGLVAQFLCSACPRSVSSGRGISFDRWHVVQDNMNFLITLMQLCAYVILFIHNTGELLSIYNFFLLCNASSCVTSSVESACALMIISCIFQKSYNWYKIT